MIDPIKKAIISQHISSRREQISFYGSYMPYNPALAEENTRRLRAVFKNRHNDLPLGEIRA